MAGTLVLQLVKIMNCSVAVVPTLRSCILVFLSIALVRRVA